MANIAILGNFGFIGSYLTQYFEKKKHTVWGLDKKWFNYKTDHSRDYFMLSDEEIKHCNVIILVAGHSSVSLCNKDPLGTYKNNVENFIRLFNRVNKRQKFIYASSSCVYGESTKPATEEDEVKVSDMLSWSKATIDNYCRFSGKNVEYYGLRLGSVAGWSRNMRTDLLVNAMTINALENKAVRVFNGDSYRPVLALKDLALGVESIINCEQDKRGIYNLSSFNIMIKHVADKVTEICPANTLYLPDTKSFNFTIDSTKFKKTFGFESSTKLSDIVKDIKDNLNEDEDNLIGWGNRDLELNYV